jgi:hypothetical protein
MVHAGTLSRLVFREFSGDIVKFDSIPQLCKSFLLFGMLLTLPNVSDGDGVQEASTSGHLLICAVR